MSDEREHPGNYNPGADAVQVMTMKVSKGLECPVVALPGVGHMPAVGEDEKEAARVFMWRLRGLRRGWSWGWVDRVGLAFGGQND